jgi:sugar O-acyltransferase (sialic acid O-acetyltransferase NeuD family)
MNNISQNKTLNLLGCAWEFVPVIFDTVYEATGIRDFNIYNNIPINNEVVMNYNKEFYNYRVFDQSDNLPGGSSLLFGVTGPKAKSQVFSYFNGLFPISFDNFLNIIHPTVYLASSIEINKGIFIEPRVIISSQTKIGNGVTIKRGVNIGHHNIIGDFCEFNPGVTTASNVTIGKGCIIGVGSVIKNNVNIGDNTFIGMGSMVNKDIPEGVIAYGSPCKVIKDNNLWKI